MAYDPSYDPSQILKFSEQEVLHGKNRAGKSLKDIINEILFIRYDERGIRTHIRGSKTKKKKSIKYRFVKDKPEPRFGTSDGTTGLSYNTTNDDFKGLPEFEPIMTDDDYVITDVESESESDSASDIDSEDESDSRNVLKLLGYKDQMKPVPNKFNTFCRKVIYRSYVKDILFNIGKQGDKNKYTYIYFLLDIPLQGGKKNNKRTLRVNKDKIITKKKGQTKFRKTRKTKGLNKLKKIERIERIKKNKGGININTQKGGMDLDLFDRIDLLERGKIRGYMMTHETSQVFKVLTICSAQHTRIILRGSKDSKKGFGKHLMQFIIDKMNNNHRIKYLYLDALVEAAPYYTQYGFILLPNGEKILKIGTSRYRELYDQQKTLVKNIGKSKTKEDLNSLFGYYLNCGETNYTEDNYFNNCIDDGFLMVLYSNKYLQGKA